MTKESNIEECTPQELSIAGIRARSVAFNAAFEKNGAGWKGYLQQAVEVLLAEIERLQHYADTCGGSENDGRCPMRHLLSPSPEVPDAKS